MELPSKLLELIVSNTRPTIAEHMLIVMDKSTHEEHLSQPLQTNVKQPKIAITFLSGYNGIFNVSDKNNKFYFGKSNTDKDRFVQITIPQGAYEKGFVNDEFRRIVFAEGHFTETDYPFTMKATFSTLGSSINISGRKLLITFPTDESIRNLKGFNASTIYEEYHPSYNPVDILSSDSILLETDIAQGMIFKGKRSGKIQNFTMDVDPRYNYIKKVRGGVHWYMMESKDFISSISFKLKNENGKLVSFNGQSFTFRLSIKQVYCSFNKCQRL